MSEKTGTGSRSVIVITMAIALTGICMTTAAAQVKSLDFSLSATVKPQFRAWADNFLPTHTMDDKGFPIFSDMVVNFTGVTSEVQAFLSNEYAMLIHKKNRTMYMLLDVVHTERGVALGNSPLCGPTVVNKKRGLQDYQATFHTRSVGMYVNAKEVTVVPRGDYQGVITLIFEVAPTPDGQYAQTDTQQHRQRHR